MLTVSSPAYVGLIQFRSHLLEHIGPEIGEFFVKQQAVATLDAAGRLKASLATSKSLNTNRKR